MATLPEWASVPSMSHRISRRRDEFTVRSCHVIGPSSGRILCGMALELTVVDAFTAKAFSGNPAAVAVLDEFPPASRMQDVAREMNLSESAFVVPRQDGSHDLRWFTPTVEVELCGHATLAAAHVLGGAGRFQTRSGVLTCTRADSGWIEMDFPSAVPEPRHDGALPFETVTWFGGTASYLLVELATAEAVRSHRPDFAAIEALGRPVIITAAGDRDGVDCVSRVFGPTLGVPEDPVTGSAHCVLAPYWAAKIERTTLVGEQASSRGGVVGMRLDGARVILSGEAVTVSTVRFV
jgi:predicted PhzF superfamily epimerase YddE/YHI9